MSLHEVVEDACDCIEGVSGILHGLDGILECRLFLIGHDGIDLSLGLSDCCLESREIMFCLDLVKLRSTEWSG